MAVDWSQFKPVSPTNAADSKPSAVDWSQFKPVEAPAAGPVASQLRTSANVDRSWGEAIADTASGIGQAGFNSIAGVVRGVNDRAPGAAEAERESGFVAGLLMDVGGKVYEAGLGAQRAVGNLIGDAEMQAEATRGLEVMNARRAQTAPEDLKRSGFAEAFAEKANEYADAVPPAQSEKAQLISAEMAQLSQIEGLGDQTFATIDYFASPFLRGDLSTGGARVSKIMESLIPSLAAGGIAAKAVGAAGAGAGIQTAAQLGTMSVMEGGGAAEGARGEVLNTPIEALQAAPEFQAALRMTGGDPLRARDLLADQAASISFGLGTAAAGATMGLGQVFGANVAEQAVREGVGSLATGAGVRQALLGTAGAAGKEFASEFAQGASNQAAQNVGTFAAGANDNLGRGVVAAGIMEGIAGGASGVAAQAAAEVSKRLRPIEDGEDLLGGSNVATGAPGAAEPGGLNLPDDPAAQPISSAEIEALRQQQLAALLAKRDGRPDQTVVDPVTGKPVTVRGEPKQVLNDAERQILGFLQKYADRPDVLARALGRRLDDSATSGASADTNGVAAQTSGAPNTSPAAPNISQPAPNIQPPAAAQPAAEPVAPAPVAPQSPAAQQQGVPTMITQAMKAQLRERGYTDANIRGMTPQQAWDAINAPAQPAPESQPAQPGPVASALRPQPADDLLVDQAAAELQGMDDETPPIAGAVAIDPQPEEVRNEEVQQVPDAQPAAGEVAQQGLRPQGQQEEVAMAPASAPPTGIVSGALAAQSQPADPDVVEGQLPADSTFAAAREREIPSEAPPPESFIPQVLSEIGWLQKGGFMIRDPETAIGASSQAEIDPERGDVVDRTKWIGKPAADGTESQFWRMRPNRNLSEEDAAGAVAKWRQGRKLGPRQQEFIDYMLKAARDYAEQWNTERAEAMRAIVDLEAEGIVEERDQLRAAVRPDLSPEDEREALQLDDLLRRAAAAGATREQLLDILTSQPERQQAKTLWHFIKTQERDRGTDEGRPDQAAGLQPEAGSRGQAEPDRSGEAAPGAAEAEPAAAPAAESRAEGLTLSAPAAPPVSQQARAPSQQGGLFAPPTRGEQLKGEAKRREDERNGKNATGRTDMMAGDGELFAGPRPEQVDVEQAIEAEQAVSPSQGEKVEAAAAEAATSPENDRPEPTDAQREAGNYKKGALSLHGMRISIENPAGTRRRPEWPPLAHHYGYFRGTEGKDGDHVDVFLGPDAENAALPVFVVDQVTQAGRFDEHKVMLGFADEAAARAGYLANYSEGWQGLGDITQMTLAEFKAWVMDPARTSKRASADAQLLEAEAETMAEAPAPAPTAEDSAPAPIRDFGEKIGGARKDTAMPTGARGKSAREAEDERPTWAKRYEVSQVAASTLDPEETGRWMIRDKRTKDRMGQQKLVGERAGYATREEAEAALPLIELARNHRITMSSRADGVREFLIVRSVTERKYVVLKNGFASREDAMRYMVENAVELIETRTSFGEIDLPLPPSRERRGAARRERDVRDSDFSDVFGFRGVEFGNWNNQAERQELLNDAYDGLIDLSDVLGIPPRAISLGGELALAFGARGHGLSGARAHYEPTRPVINLTKENGAGSLAHEWMHALDHYLWRRGNPRVKWKTNDDGTRSLDLIGNDFDLNSMSGGTARDNVRVEIRELFQKLNVTMSRKAVEYVNDTAKVEAWVAKARDQVKSELDTLRGYLARPIDYAKRNNKPASADQLAAFDTLAEQILTGRDVTLRAESPPKARKGSYSTRWTNDAINGISSILKAVRGTEGFTSDGKGTMNRIASFVRYYGQRLDEMAKANEGETEVKAVPTDFKRAAKELDQGRTGDYWSLPSEMLARAFQGYVEDKIAERGGFSPFLNFGPEQAVIVSPWGFVAPFPRGAERKAINAVFDELFQTLQVSDEGDGRVGLFSRPRQQTSNDVPASVFYSAALRAIEAGAGAPRRADAAAWKGWLDGAVRRGDMKQSERDWLDIDGWLDRQPGAVTREALAEFVRANEVQVSEVVLGDSDLSPDDLDWREVRELGDGFAYGEEAEFTEQGGYRNKVGIFRAEDDDAGWWVYYDGQEIAEGVTEAQARQRAFGVVASNADVSEGTAASKFAQYRLPGGENYRELLLTLPGNSLTDAEVESFYARDPAAGRQPFWMLSDAQRAAVAKQAARERGEYRSSHWDQPNVLAHIRMDERTDAEGKRVLFVQEIQSDWHQAGRKKGYGPKRQNAAARARMEQIERELGDRAMDDPEWQQLDAANPPVEQGVPDAPLKATDEWAMLAFKRAARWAVDNGFDRIAWATGEQNADLFDLSKTISRVEYTSDGRLLADDTRGRTAINEQVPEDRLPEYIGKEAAEKLLAQKPSWHSGLSSAAARSRVLEGQQLKVGGEGMRGFYDKILPAAVSKWGKKFGAKVGEASITTAVPGGIPRYLYVDGRRQENPAYSAEQKVHAIDITPAMREAVQDGQPLFSQPQPGDRIPMGPLQSEVAIRLALAAALDRWNGAKPIVRVVRTAKELPADAKMGEGWQEAEGYFDGADGVWLVTENLSDPQRALEVLRHEAVGHFGVERIAGAAWPSIVAGVEAMRGQKRTGMSKPMAAALAEAEARYEAAASDDPLLFAKELLAVMSETGTRAGFMDRMLSQLRAFLRKTGLIGEAFSEAELRNVLSGAFRLVERGGSLTAGAPVATGGMQSIRPDDVAAYILRMMGKSDADLFRYPKSESTSFAKVIKDVSRGEVSAVKLGEVEANFTENLDDLLPAVKWGLRLPDGAQAFVYVEQPSPYTPSTGLRMFLDASAGNAGASLGSAVYAGLFQWALNTGHTFIGDPNGLSTEALLRRTEHMLSAALKHGTTRMMAPHDRQIDPMDKKWGPSQEWAHPLQWTDGDDVGNITALIRTSVENHRALLKGTEADGAVYRLSDGQFLGAGGQPLTDEGLRRAAATAGARFRASGRFAGPESRAAAVGGSTVARTLVLGSLLDRSTGSTGERRALLADLAERLSAQSLTYDRARGLFYSRPGADQLQPQDQTETPEFRRWFGDSKVADSEGRPLVVYHGTGRDFDAFSDNPNGIFFGTSPEVAASYSRINGEAPRIVPAYLSIKNPWTMVEYGPDVPYSQRIDQSVPALKARGFDGFHDPRDGRWVAFRPEQIKSATGNRGTFDPADPRITFSRPRAAVLAARQRVQQLISREAIDRLIYEFQDKFVDLKRIQAHIREAGGTVSDLNDAYLGEELYHSRVMARHERFMESELKPLLADLNAAGFTVEQFEQFLHARHAPEANAVLMKRNPDAKTVQDERDRTQQAVRALEIQLQKARNAGAATAAIEQALEIAEQQRDYWKRVQPFRGTDAERAMLSGMSDADAAAVMAALSPADRAKMDALAGRIDAINAKTLDQLERYGLMSRADLDAWRKTYQFYVPLHRDEANPDSTSHPTGAGFSVRGDAAKSRTGSAKAKVTNILAHIAMQREAAITRGEKNAVAKKLYVLAGQNPDPNLWTLDKAPTMKRVDPVTGTVRSMPDPTYRQQPNVVMVRIAGEDRAIVFNDRNPRALRLAESLKNLDVDDLHVVLGWFSKATRWLASVNTQYNPVFGIVNLIRDTQGVVLQLSTTPLKGKEAQVLRRIPAMLRSIYRERRGKGTASHEDARLQRLWDDMRMSGGVTGYRDLFRDPMERANAIEEELQKESRGTASRWAYAVKDWLSDYNEAIENATRLAAYEQALAQGMTKERAASIAKNITVNFNRKGRQARELGALYAFFNAAVQGTARMLETLAGPRGRAIMAGGVALGFVNSLIGLAVMGGDEWEKIPAHVKERAVIIPISGKDYISIPMPLGYHVFPNIGRIAAEMMTGTNDTAAGSAGELLRIGVDSFNPLGGTSTPLQMIMPTALDPVAALAENKDWTGRPIYREDFSSTDPTPGFTRSKDTASMPAKVIAWVANAITGGDDYEPGAFSPTPDQIDYVIGQLTGGLGREILKAQTTLTAPITGEELPAYKIPLVSRLYGNTRGTAGESERFYANLAELNIIERRMKGMARAGEDVDAYMAAEPLTDLVGMGTRSQSVVQRLRSAQRQATAAGDSEQSEAIRAQITEVMADLNREVRAAKQ